MDKGSAHATFQTLLRTQESLGSSKQYNIVIGVTQTAVAINSILRTSLTLTNPDNSAEIGLSRQTTLVREFIHVQLLRELHYKKKKTIALTDNKATVTVIFLELTRALTEFNLFSPENVECCLETLRLFSPYNFVIGTLPSSLLPFSKQSKLIQKLIVQISDSF